MVFFFNHKKDSIVSWYVFVDELITLYVDIKANTFFSQLINLRQRGPIIEHIQHFQKLSLRVKNPPKNNLLDLYIVSQWKYKNQS
jgi:hypothetical protein